MNQFKLPPLIQQMFNRIGLIYEAHQLCVGYSNNHYIPETLRTTGNNYIPIYREMLISEIELVKTILLSEMNKEEDFSWHE